MRWRNIKKGTPAALKKESGPTVHYAGFWSRVMGFVTDLFMIGMPVSLLMMMVFGRDEMKSADGMDLIMQREEAVANAPDPTASIMQILLSMALYVFFSLSCHVIMIL